MHLMKTEKSKRCAVKVFFREHLTKLGLPLVYHSLAIYRKSRAAGYIVVVRQPPPTRTLFKSFDDQ